METLFFKQYNTNIQLKRKIPTQRESDKNCIEEV